MGRNRPIGLYTAEPWLARWAAAGYVLLALFFAAYGHFYAQALVDGQSVVPFLVPFGVGATLVLWTMPEIENPPVNVLNRLYVYFIFALLAWPDYLALTLPGMPWITAVRLVGVPLIVTLLICSFGSTAFRRRLKEILAAENVLVRLLIGFMVIATLTVVFSHAIGPSMNRLFVAYMAWFGVFFASCWHFQEPGRAEKFAKYLFYILLICLVPALFEAKYSVLPWVGHIPSFLDVEDPNAQRIMQGSFRAATGIYRVQSKFSSSIGLGEFIAMSMPFALHLLWVSRSKLLRATIILVQPVLFYIVIRTDSRLAFIGYFSSIIIYLFVFAVMRWRQLKTSILAPAIVLSYPIALSVLLVLSLTWRRLYVKIWGGGAQQFSSQSRADQMKEGLPKVFHAPWGHGIGEGATTLNYIAPGSDFPTIDSYYLSVALEFGVLGFAVFYGMFLWAAFKASRTAIETRNTDLLFLLPAAIALLNFLISKSIYSQTENQPLAFMLLGLIVALIYRHKLERTGAGAFDASGQKRLQLPSF